MILKVFKPEEGTKTKETFVRLDEDDGDVRLIVCDENGERVTCGSLLVLRNDGILELYDSIDKSLGFQLTDRGKLKEADI